MADEFASWIHDGEDIKSMGRFPDIPLRVIARDKIISIRNWMRYDIPEGEAVRHENKWRELQEELALLSNQGELIIASDSNHLIYIDRPDVVIACLKEFVGLM